MSQNILFLLFNSYMNKTKENDKIILDPVSTMFRLAILSFKKNGTKLRIKNNRIHFQEPSALRGFFRWSYGDSKNYLGHLYEPICVYLHHYNEDNNIKHYQQLENFVIEGLKKLQNTYINYNVINHSLQHYIKLIKHRDIDTEYNVNNFDDTNVWSTDEILLCCNLLHTYSHTKEISTLNALEEIINGKDTIY